jgi:hypothetical protein
MAILRTLNAGLARSCGRVSASSRLPRLRHRVPWRVSPSVVRQWPLSTGELTVVGLGRGNAMVDVMGWVV